MTATPFRELPIIGQRADTDGVVIERADGSNGRMSMATLIDGLGVPGVAGTGMPVFSASVVYDTATHTLEGTATNYDDPLPLPSLLAVVLPSVAVFLPLDTDPLTVEINTVSGPLIDVLGNPVSARQLTPGAIHVMVRGTTGYRLLAELHVRPPDWDWVLFWIPEGVDFPLTPANVTDAADNGTGVPGAVVVSSGLDVTIPLYTGAASRWWVMIGIPLNARDLDPSTVRDDLGRIITLPTLGVSYLFGGRASNLDGATFRGAPYKWWFTNGNQPTNAIRGMGIGGQTITLSYFDE